MTYVLNCTNTECGCNKNSRCSLHKIVVNKKGQCMLASNKKQNIQNKLQNFSTRADIAKDLNIQIQLLSYHLLSLGIKPDKKVGFAYYYNNERVPEIVEKIKGKLRKINAKYAKEEDRPHGK